MVAPRQVLGVFDCRAGGGSAALAFCFHGGGSRWRRHVRRRRRSQRRDGSCGQGLSPVHSAHVGQEMEVHYRWHPYFGRKVRICRVEERATGRFLKIQGPSGVVVSIAAWMLDPVECAGMTMRRVADGFQDDDVLSLSCDFPCSSWIKRMGRSGVGAPSGPVPFRQHGGSHRSAWRQSMRSDRPWR